MHLHSLETAGRRLLVHLELGSDAPEQSFPPGNPVQLQHPSWCNFESHSQFISLPFLSLVNTCLVTHQVPLSMGFPRQEYSSGVAISSSRPPGNLPQPGIEPGSPALQVGSLPLSHQGSSLSSETFHNTPVPTKWCPKAIQSCPLVATWWFMALDSRLNLGFRK